MGEVLLNGRRPLDFELAALEHGRRCERERDMELLAGLLPDPDEDQPEPGRRPRLVTDIGWGEFG